MAAFVAKQMVGNKLNAVKGESLENYNFLWSLLLFNADLTRNSSNDLEFCSVCSLKFI